MPGQVDAVELDAELAEVTRERFPESQLPGWAAARESEHPRWVWADARRWYPGLLAAGVRIERCIDLRMCRTILRNASATSGTDLARAPHDAWDEPARATGAPRDTLFDLDDQHPDDDPVTELRRQRAAIDASTAPGRLSLLTAADSLGALVAIEMEHAGLPWNAERHTRILTALLGERTPGPRPARMQELVARIRTALDDPTVNPDSPPALLKSLQRAGLRVSSTSRWELRSIEHPVIEPLMTYKKLARLYTANGWAWLAEWVHGGRFRPVYVPAAVVTGRWATDGGGALQLPHQVRDAVVPDYGWKLVVADAAQLEPRVLAAVSQDTAMARAGQAHDLYRGMVEAGAVETREQAKYGMLGAIYGGTTGESARMRPRIARAFPRAMAYVEAAARAGEAGQTVSTWLGRTSHQGAVHDYDETASDAERRRSRGDDRARGRFTRNFVVQGTAAEWAMCWMGSLRRMLWNLGGPDTGGASLTERPHLVFFLHDELIVHTPAHLADQVADAMRTSAAEAGRMLFGDAPVEFPVTVAIVDSYADAK